MVPCRLESDQCEEDVRLLPAPALIQHSTCRTAMYIRSRLLEVCCLTTLRALREAEHKHHREKSAKNELHVIERTGARRRVTPCTRRPFSPVWSSLRLLPHHLYPLSFVPHKYLQHGELPSYCAEHYNLTESAVDHAIQRWLRYSHGGQGLCRHCI